ncbi:MAG: hypothetical protein CVT67_02810 [Actinobacteria bacterium HGW-Actinobacteria-7]|jgi:hypothetical protein|nr:MAG: hypothetical protein CVT67_02810 [Actinobacteria bacterium HGW-Actinobacteria-7]
MLKSEAKRRASAVADLDPLYTHFANINWRRNIWWIDVPLSKVDADKATCIELLLFDHRRHELHHLRVPSGYLLAHLDGLTVRKKKAEVIQLELSANLRCLFENVAPVASGVRFGQFLEHTLDTREGG